MADDVTSPPHGTPPDPVKLPNGEAVGNWQAWAQTAWARIEADKARIARLETEASKAAQLEADAVKATEYRSRVAARLQTEALTATLAAHGFADPDVRAALAPGLSALVVVDAEALTADTTKLTEAVKALATKLVPPAPSAPAAPQTAAAPAPAAPAATPPAGIAQRVVPGYPAATAAPPQSTDWRANLAHNLATKIAGG